MSNAIIGSKGFIGSALKLYADTFLEEEWIGIDQDNYGMWKGHKFNNVVWCAGTARKDLSEDELFISNCIGLVDTTIDFPCEKFIYVSSQAVYGGPNIGIEDMEIDTHGLSPYGLSKYFGELYTRNKFSHWLILRPNGFVGPGLKKNVIHSLAKDPPERYYTSDSRFQIIHVDTFAEVLFSLNKTCSNEVFNVTSREIIIPHDVAKIMGVDIKSIVNPQFRIPPRVDAVMDTWKLTKWAQSQNLMMPSTEEVIQHWNKRLKIGDE